MAKKISIAAIGVLVILGGLMLAGEYSVLRRSNEVCNICKRHINPKAGVVAEIGGQRRRVCCAHCAITEGLQEHQPVRLIQVSDYNSGAKLDPQHAWFVDGSRIVACEHDMSHMDMSKRPDQMAFDRCSPGTFAFAGREQAETFVAQNGGTVRSLDQLMTAFGTSAEPGALTPHHHEASAPAVAPEGRQ